MIIYIYLLWHQIVIYCAQGVGCMQTSTLFFNQLIALGTLELLFELPGIVSIYLKKEDKPTEESKEV